MSLMDINNSQERRMMAALLTSLPHSHGRLREQWSGQAVYVFTKSWRKKLHMTLYKHANTQRTCKTPRLQLRLGYNQPVGVLQRLDSIADELVHNFPGSLLLVANSSDLAHQERSCVVHCLVIKIVTQLLQVVLDGQNALASQLLDLSCSVLLPILNVWVLADTEGPPGEDDCADVVVEARCGDGFLVSFGGTGLLSKNEASSNPNARSTKVEHGSDGLATEDATSGDDLHLLAGERRLVALDHLDRGGDEDRCRCIASVSTTLATLRADDVDTEVEALLDVLGMTDHVHVEDAVLVQLLDNGLGWDTDGGDKELSSRVDDNVD
jgi:hypothetical protein